MTSTPLDHLTLLAQLQDAFAEGIPRVDPDTPVPWCGRWRVRHLVVHLGRIHHWAAAQAARTREVPLGRGPFELVPFYRAQADELLGVLHRLDPDATTSTLVGPGPVRFWHRRQAHETLVHLWDLRAVAGLDVAVPAQIWADTVDEVVTVMQPRQVGLGRMAELTVAVDLVATDAGTSWRLGPGDPPEDLVTVRGTAQDLALLLWGRREPDALTVDGDRATLGEVLVQRLTP